MEDSASRQPSADLTSRFRDESQRGLSVVISALFGGMVGYIVGRSGDHQYRTLGGPFGALFGGLIGGLISHYSTKGTDLRPYDLVNEPNAIRQRAHLPVDAMTEPRKEALVREVMREGRLEEPVLEKTP